jgi:DNA-directed RNA polymerase III subunit RPC6
VVHRQRIRPGIHHHRLGLGRTIYHQKGWFPPHLHLFQPVNKVLQSSKSYPGGSSQAIYPPSYTGYPTLTNIVRVLENSKLVNVELKEADVQVIIDRLVFDGKIERKARVAAAMDEDDEDDVVYKAVRDRFGKKTAWTEVPCGTCPVYERCDDEGPITPLKCEYLKKWLAF